MIGIGSRPRRFAAIGQPVPYRTAEDVRDAIATALEGHPAYRDLRTLTFARPVGARDWLQASNPSERWKWDYLFQDLPPVKFDWMKMPDEQRAIPLQPIAAEKPRD